MGKASRRKRQAQAAGATTGPGGDPTAATTDGAGASTRAPHITRPFEGLATETEWVALREIVPAATADLVVRLPEEAQDRAVVLATVLPGAMPAVHRADGTVLVALQSRTHSGDASRDLAQALLAAVAAGPGTPVTSVRPATAQTPRMQDLVVGDGALAPSVHADFGFWVDQDGDEAADPELAAVLERTNETAVPTQRVEGVDSAYWCRMGERAYVRWILPDDEDDATTALARLQATGEHTLGGESVLLGAFRAAGLLVPVLEVDPAVPAEEHGPALGELAQRYAAALARTEPLSPAERRARSGLVSRQVTLR